MYSACQNTGKTKTTHITCVLESDEDSGLRIPTQAQAIVEGSGSVAVSELKPAADVDYIQVRLVYLKESFSFVLYLTLHVRLAYNLEYESHSYSCYLACIFNRSYWRYSNKVLDQLASLGQETWVACIKN